MIEITNHVFNTTVNPVTIPSLRNSSPEFYGFSRTCEFLLYLPYSPS